MTYDEFVDAYRNGTRFLVDESRAGFLYGQPGLLPSGTRAKQTFIRTLFYLGTLGGIAAFFFMVWYQALGILIVGLYMSRMAQRDAASGVLKAALRHPQVYEVAMDAGVINVKA